MCSVGPCGLRVDLERPDPWLLHGRVVDLQASAGQVFPYLDLLEEPQRENNNKNPSPKQNQAIPSPSTALIHFAFHRARKLGGARVVTVGSRLEEVVDSVGHFLGRHRVTMAGV